MKKRTTVLKTKMNEYYGRLENKSNYDLVNEMHSLFSKGWILVDENQFYYTLEMDEQDALGSDVITEMLPDIKDALKIILDEILSRLSDEISKTENTKTMSITNDKKYVLKKDIVIPAGTVFEERFGKTEYINDNFETIIGLTDDSCGSLVYGIDPGDPELLEWFDEVQEWQPL